MYKTYIFTVENCKIQQKDRMSNLMDSLTKRLQLKLFEVKTSFVPYLN